MLLRQHEAGDRHAVVLRDIEGEVHVASDPAPLGTVGVALPADDVIDTRTLAMGRMPRMPNRVPERRGDSQRAGFGERPKAEAIVILALGVALTNGY